MRLRCKKEACRIDGSKIMHFTKGMIYEFEQNYDPPGWSVIDDKGNEVVFSNIIKMFEPI